MLGEILIEACETADIDAVVVNARPGQIESQTSEIIRAVREAHAMGATAIVVIPPGTLRGDDDDDQDDDEE